jgi:hypothetical protein
MQKNIMEVNDKLNFEVLDSKEVWWETTRQYELQFTDGKTLKFRIAESPKYCDLLVLTERGWSALDEDDAHQKIIYEQWCENGAIE